MTKEQTNVEMGTVTGVQENFDNQLKFCPVSNESFCVL